MHILQPTGFLHVVSVQRELLAWLRNVALPLWEAHGIDRANGGYFENLRIDAERNEIAGDGEFRRGRVVSRQLYVFALGRRLGWQPVHADPVSHGCSYLFSRMHCGEGLFHTDVHAETGRPRQPFSLYEYSFYLFALAHVYSTSATQFPAIVVAEQCLAQLRKGWGKTGGGFNESNPASLPLKSNPHMHLLEAAIAWIDVADGPQRDAWIELARELVQLCLDHFIDARSGAIREYFDTEWRPMDDESGRIVEPGHQFEWAWLLIKWVERGDCDSAERDICRAAAHQLIETGELRGIDNRHGVAINELWDDFTVRDGGARLWPQTERMKAWCAMLELSQDDRDAEFACRKIVAAARGLNLYLMQSEVAGLWRECLREDGTFANDEACKASSFYHIACAIETLHRTVNTIESRRRAEADYRFIESKFASAL